METIGNYIIEKSISENGPTRVYQAKHKKLGRKTLLKVHAGGDDRLIQRFEREAKIVADLNSDAIVAIYDYGEEAGNYYISMEYVEGWNLKEYIEQHTLDVDDIIDFTYQIARSVAVIHEKGYVHRDLKPENILVSKERKIKLTDFGISLQSTLSRVTTEGSLLGTPLYMSPEQINNLPITSASDMFSLGIIFYQLAGNQHPFEAENIGEIFSKILIASPAALRKLNPILPKWYETLIQKLLQKDVKKRMTDATQVVHLIEENATELKTKENKQENQDEWQFSPLIKWAGSLAALALVVFFIVYIYNREPDNDLPPPALIDTTAVNNQIAENKQDSITRSLQPATTEINQPISEKRTDKQAEPTTEKPDREETPLNPPPTTFKIDTYPWCKVYLNYTLIDTVPMSSPLEIEPGRYTLSLQSTDYPSFTERIDIKPNQDNYFSYNLDSIFYRLELDVIPWGKVYIDDKFIGTTPLQKPLYLSRKKHTLKIENDFFQTWIDTIHWQGEPKITQNIVLKQLN